MSNDKVETTEFDMNKSGQLWIKEDDAVSPNSFTLKSELKQSKILTALGQDEVIIKGNLWAI